MIGTNLRCEEGNMKITVVTISYNAEKTIEQTIRSVISQKYDNVEYIIIDGGSTDQTVDIIRKNEKYVSYWISESDKGVYDAMNKGLSHSSGDVITFLNSDDYYLEDALKYVAQYFEKNNLDILCCEVMVEQDRKLHSHSNPWESFPEKLREGYMMYSHQGIFAKRECFTKWGNFNTSYRIVADYDWLLRLYNQNVKLAYSPKVVAVFRYGGLSTNNLMDTVDEVYKVAKWHAKNEFQTRKITSNEYKSLCQNIQSIIGKQYLYAYAQMCKMNGAQLLKNVIYPNVNAGVNYAIFGVGKLGIACLSVMKSLEMQVEFFVDNDIKKWNTIVEGVKVKNPQELIEQKVFIVVASQYYEEEIFEQLEDLGLKKEINYIGCAQLCQIIKNYEL